MRKKVMIRHILRVFIIAIIACGVHSSGLALTNEEVFSQFQFNLITPGARATALGGAFIGLADDATTVGTNPAGLTILNVPEVSIELKHISYTAEHLYENRNPETDITKREFDDSVGSVSFVSVVYPYKRFVFSLYRQELVNYKSSYQTGVFPIDIPGTDRAFYPMDASVDLTVINYGIGAAIHLFEGFSIAVSPIRSHMKMISHSTRFGLNTSPGPTDFMETDVVGSSEIDNEDIGYSVNAGILWKPHPKVSIGAVYRSGAEFTVTETIPGQRGYDPDLTEFTLKVPDSSGVGTAFRVTDFLTLTLDAVHIRYEDLLEDFDIVMDPSEFTKENYTVDNTTEVHFGVEYILTLEERLLALRAGVYNEPDHTIRFTGTMEDPTFDIIGRELFPGGDDQIHITGGLGLVISDRFQIDTAANIADRSTQLSFSVIYRF